MAPLEPSSGTEGFPAQSFVLLLEVTGSNLAGQEISIGEVPSSSFPPAQLHLPPGDDLFVVYNEGRDYSDPTSTFRCAGGRCTGVLTGQDNRTAERKLAVQPEDRSFRLTVRCS